MKTTNLKPTVISGKHRLRLLVVSIMVATVSQPVTAQEQKENKWQVFGDFRLRYENVQQDNDLEDADGLTLRSRVGVKSKEVRGFSGVVEVENTTKLVDDFSVSGTGDNVGEFSGISDPDTTEIDQAYISYSSDKLKAKIGRQVFTLDGHRFIGHVGFRQDRQTYDAVVINYTPLPGFEVNASYIDQRNRIFSDEQDVDSNDIIFNSSYRVPFGKVVAYAYLLEEDEGVENSLDTYGFSFTGDYQGENVKWHYSAEFATQEDNEGSEADYLAFSGGATVAGITAKIGYESLGSDDGLRGFATPLATLHKFNGWADVFLTTPAQGLEEVKVSVSGPLAGGEWVLVYQDFSSDVSLNGATDLGEEFGAKYTRAFGDRFSGGVKLADYNAGDSAFSQIDTQRFWLWANYNF